MTQGIKICENEHLEGTLRIGFVFLRFKEWLQTRCNCPL